MADDATLLNLYTGIMNVDPKRGHKRRLQAGPTNDRTVPIDLLNEYVTFIGHARYKYRI